MTKRINYSVRLSYEFYDHAKSEAELHRRTIANQIEYWSTIGMEMEKELNAEQIYAILQKNRKNKNQ